jgi:hypothetical protein
VAFAEEKPIETLGAVKIVVAVPKSAHVHPYVLPIFVGIVREKLCVVSDKQMPSGGFTVAPPSQRSCSVAPPRGAEISVVV